MIVILQRDRGSLRSSLCEVHQCKTLFLLCCLLCTTGSVAGAQTIVGNVGLGDYPVAAAVDPVLNKIYIANLNSNSVTIVDEFTDSSTSVAVGTAPTSIAVDPATGHVYTANAGDGTISVIDGITDAVTATIHTGRSPVAIAVNAVTNKIYVANRDDDTMTVIDDTTGATSTVAVGSNPVALSVNPVDGVVYVVNQKSNSVTVFDATKGTTTSVAVGALPSSIALNPTTNVVYVVNERDSTVTALNRSTSATATISVGSAPASIAINPTTNTIYVPSSADSTVSVINGATNTATTVSVTLQPLAVVVDSISNKVYVANDGGNSTSSGGNLVSVLDGATNQVINIPGAGKATTIAFDPKAGRLYVPDLSSNAATVITTASNEVTSFAVGLSPQAIAFNAVTQSVFVCNYSSASLTIVDGSSNNVTNVPVSGQPDAVAVNPVTNKVYVASLGSSSITVVDAASKSVVATIPIAYSDTYAIAVNPVTNMIYVVASESNQLIILDGVSNNVTTMPVGNFPASVAINAITNKIYIANESDTFISVLDGNTSTIMTVPVPVAPGALTVNSATNKVYSLASNASLKLGATGSTLLILDGATDQVSKVPIASTGIFSNAAVVINQQTNTLYIGGAEGDGNAGSLVVLSGATNDILDSVSIHLIVSGLALDAISGRVYVTDGRDQLLTVIDGATHTTATVSAERMGSLLGNLIVNPITGNAYVLDGGSNSIDVVTPNRLQPVPLTVNVSGVVDGQTISTTNLFQTKNPSPLFTAQIASSYAGAGISSLTANPPPTGIYYQIDGGEYFWTKATPASTIGANPATFTMCVDNVPVGLHALYFFPTYGDESAGTGSGNGSGSSVELGNIQGLMFLIAPGGSSNGSSPSCASLAPPPATAAVATTTTLSSSANPQLVGFAVTFTAIVTPSQTSSSSPSGTISFFDGTTKLGTSALTSGSIAAYTTSSLAAGSHSITVSYGGDANFSGSASGVLLETIEPATPITTTTVIASSVNPQVVGSNVTFTSTVTSSQTGSPPPSGMVSFFDGTTKLGTTVLASGGIAAYTTSSLVVGNHSMTASYTGDVNFGASTSAVLTQIIVAASVPGDFSLQSSQNTVSVPSGDWTQLAVTVAPVGGFTGQVALSCGRLPEHAQCVFQNNSLASVAGSAVNVQLVLNTSDVYEYGRQVSRVPSLMMPGEFWRGGIYFAIVFPLVGFFGGSRRRSCRRFWASRILLVLGMGFVGISLLQGCSGKLPAKAAPGTYNIVVMGTNSGGSTQHEIPIQLLITN